MSLDKIAASSSPIVISDYDPAWPRQYGEEEARLKRRLRDRILQIEHIGSTAVPGLGAKPILDILIVVESDAVALSCAPLLDLEGYKRIPEIEKKLDRYYFEKGDTPPGNVHVHLFTELAAEPRRLVGFRDALRADPEVARQYEDLKRELAEKFQFQRFRYSSGKSMFILKVLTRLPAG